MPPPLESRYHRGHYLIWQGVSFPDGMVVMDNPAPGYMNDPLVWANCGIRNDLENIMLTRMAENPPRRRLKLYADKIYTTSPLITAAFSRRHGALQAWMIVENSIMSKIRVAIEW